MNEDDDDEEEEDEEDDDDEDIGRLLQDGLINNNCNNCIAERKGSRSVEYFKHKQHKLIVLQINCDDVVVDDVNDDVDDGNIDDNVDDDGTVCNDDIEKLSLLNII